MGDDDDKEDNVIKGDFGPGVPPHIDLGKSIGPLLFGDGKGYYYVFEPRQDMTAYEVSRLVQLFIVSITNPKVTLDRIGFITKHKLNRHFVHLPLPDNEK